ncbi:MAG: LexA family protein [Pyrinomonadaceae bacterium]
MSKAKPTNDTLRIPILSEVFAGKPVPLETLSFAGWREIRSIKGARLGDRFAAAPIRGDSLIEDHITDGDILIIHLTSEAKIGDLAVALTPDGVTVKYIHAQVEGLVLLRGANSIYEDQIWDASEITIQGVVKRVERDI